MKNEAGASKSIKEELKEKFKNEQNDIGSEAKPSQPLTDWFNPWWLFVRNPGGFGRLVYS